jgi:hypothetical protein
LVGESVPITFFVEVGDSGVRVRVLVGANVEVRRGFIVVVDDCVMVVVAIDVSMSVLVEVEIDWTVRVGVGEFEIDNV